MEPTKMAHNLSSIYIHIFISINIFLYCNESLCYSSYALVIVIHPSIQVFYSKFTTLGKAGGTTSKTAYFINVWHCPCMLKRKC